MSAYKKFYIITPTFNSLQWLEGCVRSVADQVGQGIEVHHHIQDGGSVDGTLEWVETWKAKHEADRGYVFTYESESDNGMYDALNRAWAKMPTDADITAHLNSDEQYLPDVLKSVSAVFKRCPRAELVACSYIIVDSEGRYICHRRSVKPSMLRSMVSCELNTCSCFHRVDVFRKHTIRPNLNYRAIADMLMYADILKYGVRIKVMPSLMTSIFVVTGGNLSCSELDTREREIYYRSLSPWLVRNRRYLEIISCILRRINDWMCSSPRLYACYRGNNQKRTTKYIKHPTAHWGMRTHAVDEE